MTLTREIHKSIGLSALVGNGVFSTKTNSQYLFSLLYRTTEDGS
jgi:hypothetical protein